MKKIILLTFTILCCFFSQAQTVTDTTKQIFPQYEVRGKDTLVVLTIEQAQKIDNDYELFYLLEHSKISCDSTIKYYVAVVNEYGRRVALLVAKSESLEKINKNQTVLIDNLNQQIANYKLDLKKAEEQIRLLNGIIENQDKRIKGLKFQKTLGWCGTAVFFIATSILLNVHK